MAHEGSLFSSQSTSRTWLVLTTSENLLLQCCDHLGGPLPKSQSIHASPVLGSPALDPVLQGWPHQC